MAIYFHDILYLNEEQEKNDGNTLLNSFFTKYKEQINSYIKNDTNVILIDVINNDIINTNSNNPGTNNSLNNSLNSTANNVKQQASETSAK